MATASPSTVLAVPERPLPERPEPKGTDGSDGQFAGLMAHFTQPPPPPKAPDAHAQHQARADREATVNGSDAPAATKTAPAAVREKAGPKSETMDTKTDPSSPKPDAAAPKPDSTGPKDEVKVAADPNQANLEKPTSIQVTFNELTPAPLLPALVLPQGKGSADTAAPKTELALPQPTQPIEMPALPLPAPTKLQAGPEQVKADPLQAAPTPKTELPAPISLSTPPPQTSPKIETTPQADPTKPPVPVISQAVLAESEASAKAAQAQDEKTARDEAPKIDPSHLLDKGAKGLEMAQAPRPAAQGQVQATFQVAPQISDQEKALSAGKASAAPAAWMDPAPPTVDTAVAKAALTTQTPLTRAADGSALAALNAGPRPMETPAPTAVAAPPPPPATPPTSPVLQVEGGIKWMLKGGIQEAQLQLHPESLGQVTIHLKVEGGEVHARLWVTEPTSVQTVQDGRSHLESALKEQGLQLGSFDLQQGHRPFQETPSTPTYREQAVPEVIATRQEAPSTILPSLLNPHRVELYA